MENVKGDIMGKYIMALDAGTTSNRAIIFNKKGEIMSVAQKSSLNSSHIQAGLNMTQQKSGQLN